MIFGIGTDIIEVERIAQAHRRHGQRFLDRIFTPTEQNYCQQHTYSERHFAGRFAAKEAVVKALGTGISGGISWIDVEVVNDGSGKPTVRMSESLASQFPGIAVHLSISHCKAYAMATATIEKI